MLNLIVIRHRGDGELVRWSFHAPLHFLLLGIGVVTAAGLVGAAGFYLGQARGGGSAVTSWQMRLLEQQQTAAGVGGGPSSEVDALISRLARLQSRVTRLDALGRKLVKVSQIDAAEFDFGSAPGLGGPRVGDGAAADVAGLSVAIGAFAERVDDRARQLTVLDNVLRERRLDAASIPAGEPVDDGWMSSPYGYRKDPFTGRRAWHDGVDFAGRLGSPVQAIGGGVVTFVGKRWGYGKLVEVTHADGYVTRYAHNRELLAREGQIVRRGDIVARMGSTGRSTGPHVHLEVVKGGKPVNPWKYVQARR